jgi:hypothetical protein
MNMTTRVLPPADGLHPAITVNGHAYSCALGASLDVPDQDAAIMTANGWTAAAAGQVGTTAARPASPSRSQDYHDTTLGKTIRFDGKVWRDPATGGAV